MLENLEVEIKDRNVNNGQRGSSCYCPIALAVKEALEAKGWSHFEVFVNGIDINVRDYKSPVYYKARTPNSFEDFIRRFDADANVKAGIKETLTFKKVKYDY